MSNLFLMRWNPAISSYKPDVYHRNCEDFPEGFRIDWSVSSHDEAHTGDCYVMMRVGEYKPGIVFYGSFVSEPYTDDDWAGTARKRHYVMMDCFGFTTDDEPLLPAAILEREIAEVDWMHGHSGVVLPADIAARLTAMLESRIPGFSFFPVEPEPIDHVEKLHELAGIYAPYKPSIHSRDEDEYDWLESDDSSCRCLLIPSPYPGGNDIEVEAYHEFTLYFAGAHSHYDSDVDGYDELKQDIADIIGGKMCAYSCKYDGWAWCCGLRLMQPTEEAVLEFLKSDDEDMIRMLAEYTERDIRPDAVYTIELHFFDGSMDRTFSFRLDRLTDRIGQYSERQDEVKRLYPGEL